LLITLERIDFMAKSTLSRRHIVAKQNVLNEFRPRGITLQELRFFTVYLSKINPKDVNTRVVRFSLESYQAIMGLGSRPNMTHLKKSVERLLGKITSTTLPSGGFEMFQFFKTGKIDQDEDGDWYVEINASDEALPLMFELKSHYFRYELWNALRLKSTNQLRMYEILKQYERVGHRIISVEELKEQLGIGKGEYARFGSFKDDVLNVCQEALSQYTDISFTYESQGKKGPGGKILSLMFTITKNRGFIDPISLDDFVETSDGTLIGDDPSLLHELPPYERRIAFFSEACEDEFSQEQVENFNALLSERMPHIFYDDIQCYDYLHRKYQEMLMNDGGVGKVRDRFKYMRKLIGTD